MEFAPRHDPMSRKTSRFSALVAAEPATMREESLAHARDSRETPRGWP
jgi:hypothetical protein